MRFKLIKRRISTIRKRLNGKRILITGLILVLTFGGAILTYKKIKSSNQEHIVVKEFKKDELSNDIYLEAVDTLKSELVNTNKLSFCESQIRVKETFGYNKNDNITLESVYDIAFTVDMSKVIKGLEPRRNDILVNINREDIYLYKCEQVSDIKILNKKESLGNKFKDFFKNDDADLLHKASNRLNIVAKEEAEKSISESELRVRVENTLINLIKSITKVDTTVQINDIGGK